MRAHLSLPRSVPTRGALPLGLTLQLAAVLLVWLAASPSAATVPIRVGPTELHYGWLHAPGDTAGYHVRVSRSGGPFVIEQTVSRPEVWIPADGGEVVLVQVTAFNSYGLEGESYPLPSPVIVLDPAADNDGDGLQNGADPCPIHPHANQDTDADGIPDDCDSCPLSWNSSRSDIDGDGVGDACDTDIDGDELDNHQDLCPRLPIPEFSDRDGDGLGDACDPCSTFAWTDPPANPPDQNSLTSGIIFKNLRTPDAQGLRLEGKFTPWPSQRPIDPSATGLSFHVEDVDGPIYSLGIPPGEVGSSACDVNDGWKLSFYLGNPVWRYINRSGSLDPLGCAPAGATLVAAIIRDKRLTKGWVEYVIEFKDLELEHVPTIPAHSVAAAVTLGDLDSLFETGPSAASGSCGETFLAAPADSGFKKPFCKSSFYLGELNKITCRGP